MKDLIEIKGEISQYIIRSSYLENEQVKNDTLIFEQVILDSMGFISLISFLEEIFSVKVNDDELLESNFESINAISDLVARKLHTEQTVKP